MKLPASVLATLCAVGCEAAYTQEPQYPSQPVETYEIADPRIETIEQVEFAQPPGDELDEIEPAVAPVRQPVRRVVVQPVQPQVVHSDPCPACGMG
jgi:hypothetical protein